MFLLLSGFTSLTPTADLIGKFFSHLPFAGFYATATQRFFEEIIGISVDLPDITVNSQFLDFTKTLLATVLKAVLFYLGSKLLLVPERLMSAKQKLEYGSILNFPHVKDEDIQNVRNIRSSYLMDFMKSGKYTFLHALLSVIVMFLGIVLSELLMMPVTGLVNKLDNKTDGTVIYLLLFIIVFVITTALFALVTKHSFGVSSLLVSVFHLLPEIITVLVTNTLGFAAFASLRADNDSMNYAFITILIILVAWIIFSEWLIEKIGSYLTLASHKKRLSIAKDSKRKVSVVYWIMEYVTSTFSLLLIYVMCTMNYQESDDYLSNILFGLPFVKQLATGERILDLIRLNGISEFVVLVMLLFLLCIVSELVHHSPIKYISVSVVGWPLLEGFIMLFVIGGYALLTAIPQLFELGNMAVSEFSWLLIYLLVAIMLFLFVVYRPFFIGCILQTFFITILFLLLQQTGLVFNLDENYEVLLFSGVAVVIVAGIMNFIHSIVAIIHVASQKD